PNDDKRTKAIILFIMKDLSMSDGHMYVTSDEIKAVSEKLFRRYNLEPYDHGHNLSDIHFYRCLSILQDEGKVIAIEGKLYLRHNWKNESASASYITEFVKNGPYEFK